METELIVGKPGDFEVMAEDSVLYSKKQIGKFPSFSDIEKAFAGFLAKKGE